MQQSSSIGAEIASDSSTYADSVEGASLGAHQHDSDLALTSEESHAATLLELRRHLAEVAREETPREDA